LRIEAGFRVRISGLGGKRDLVERRESAEEDVQNDTRAPDVALLSPGRAGKRVGGKGERASEGVRARARGRGDKRARERAHERKREQESASE